MVVEYRNLMQEQRDKRHWSSCRQNAIKCVNNYINPIILKGA